MLGQWLIEAENAYRRPLSIKEENFMEEEKLIDRENWKEHYVRKGDPKKPTYYIIRLNDYGGLFAITALTLGHIWYGISKSWIPVVDMQNYPNQYLTRENFGKENVWEYYFEQPFRIGLDTAYDGENIVLSGATPPIAPPWGMAAFFDRKPDAFAEWRMFVKLGLFKVKPEIMSETLAIRDKLFPPKERILGVHLRGTDYLAKPHGHPIPPP